MGLPRETPVDRPIREECDGYEEALLRVMGGPCLMVG
jgi:hypothetical protein